MSFLAFLYFPVCTRQTRHFGHRNGQIMLTGYNNVRIVTETASWDEQVDDRKGYIQNDVVDLVHNWMIRTNRDITVVHIRTGIVLAKYKKGHAKPWFYFFDEN